MSIEGLWRSGKGIRRIAATVLLGTAWSSTLAAEEAEVPETWYDNSRSVVVDVLSDTAVWLDSFFGDPRADIERDATAFVAVTFDGFYSGVDGESSFDVRRVFTMLDELARAAAAKAPHRPEEVGGLEEGGLALAVAADEEVLTFGEAELHGLDVSQPADDEA